MSETTPTFTKQHLDHVLATYAATQPKQIEFDGNTFSMTPMYRGKRSTMWMYIAGVLMAVAAVGGVVLIVRGTTHREEQGSGGIILAGIFIIVAFVFYVVTLFATRGTRVIINLATGDCKTKGAFGERSRLNLKEASAYRSFSLRRWWITVQVTCQVEVIKPGKRKPKSTWLPLRSFRRKKYYRQFEPVVQALLMYFHGQTTTAGTVPPPPPASSPPPPPTFSR